MSQNSKSNRGGRPRKVQFEELKRVVDDYFLYIAEGNVALLRAKGVFTNLERYANSHGLPYKATDFSRCVPLRDYFSKLFANFTYNDQNSSLLVPGYAPLDIDYFLRPDITVKERQQLLVEQDGHYKNLHIKAAKALEVYESQRKEIEDLRGRLQVEILESKNDAQSMQTIKRENKKLLDENRYLKRYIHNYIEPAVAEAVIKGDLPDSLTKKAASLMPPRNNSAAIVNISELLSSDIHMDSDEDDVDRLILNIRNGVTNYRTD